MAEGRRFMSMLPSPATIRADSARECLQVDGLRFAHPGVPLFDGFSATVPAGATMLRGGDGRGKTTLLRLLAGDLAAQAGRLRAGGVDLAADPAAYRRTVFRPEMASGAFDQLTPVEVLASVRAQWPGFDEGRLEGLVEGLSLGAHMAKKMFMLSTGSKRKVWLAAAFAAGAAVTLLDDPFASLDRPSIRFVLAQLQEAAAHPARAIVFSAYEAPEGLALSSVIDLGD
ncbi:MAG TPA: ATP-binding cassette domain-containing protein [Quisquiliibacterium sp.]|nr:ATP-binding cassette domain-containing protein [Quisquiliibacterium sp.]